MMKPLLFAALGAGAAYWYLKRGCGCTDKPATVAAPVASPIRLQATDLGASDAISLRVGCTDCNAEKTGFGPSGFVL